MAYTSSRFPECITETTDSSFFGEGTEHPFAYTLDELMALTTRIKTFQIEFEFAYSLPLSPPSAYSASTGGAISSVFSRVNKSSENDIACGLGDLVNTPKGLVSSGIERTDSFGATTYRNLHYWASSDSIPITSPPASPQRALEFAKSIPTIRRYDGAYWPRIKYESFGFYEPSESGSFFSAITQLRMTGAYFSDVLFYRPGFGDSSVRMKGSASSAQYASGYLKIMPDTYFEHDPGDTDAYDGKDGSGPVYDSATGAQLRDPFNIVKRGDGTFYNPNYVAP